MEVFLSAIFSAQIRPKTACSCSLNSSKTNFDTWWRGNSGKWTKVKPLLRIGIRWHYPTIFSKFIVEICAFLASWRQPFSSYNISLRDPGDTEGLESAKLPCGFDAGFEWVQILHTLNVHQMNENIFANPQMHLITKLSIAIHFCEVRCP